jgi:hypothetical protein
LEATELAIAYFYILLVAYAADFYDCGVEFCGDFESLGARQLFFAVHVLCATEDSVYQIFVLGHFAFLQKNRHCYA